MNWTATNAAKEFGVSRETILRGLRGAGVDTKKNAAYPTRLIHKILAGDLKAEKIRETRARADLLELERREKEREIITLSEAQAHQSAVLAPIRQRLMALPAEMASRTNPIDPKFARKALERWRDESLKGWREEIAKI